jgi:hypothetical protein
VIEVCEGVSSVWHYHLREAGSTTALCGAHVMLCHVPLDRWNKPVPNHHVPESFCSKCNEVHEA